MRFTLKDGWYDKLKWVCLIFLPAVSTLYFTISSIWGWGYTTEVLGTIAAIETFIGSVIGISHINYYKDTDDGNTDEV